MLPPLSLSGWSTRAGCSSASSRLLAGRTNPNVASDLEVAVLLIDAAAQGAAANVTTNLRSMHDRDAAAQIGARVEHVEDIRLVGDRTRALIRAPEGATPPPRSP